MQGSSLVKVNWRSNCASESEGCVLNIFGYVVCICEDGGSDLEGQK